jgi:hypothetical protein
MIHWPLFRLLAAVPWRSSLRVPAAVRLAAEYTPLILPRARAPTRMLPGTAPRTPRVRTSTPSPSGPESPLKIQRARRQRPGLSSTPPFAAAARGKKP